MTIEEFWARYTAVLFDYPKYEQIKKLVEKLADTLEQIKNLQGHDSKLVEALATPVRI